jgi:hypothetical protein
MFVFSSQTEMHGGQQINEWMGYALAHKGRATVESTVYDSAEGPKAYTNVNVYNKLARYTAAALERHGSTFDPTIDPLDTDLVMRVRGGKQHGWYFIANSAIEPSSIQMLSQIQRGGTRSGPEIPIVPRQSSSSQMMTTLQVSAVSFVVHSFHT